MKALFRGLSFPLTVQQYLRIYWKASLFGTAKGAFTGSVERPGLFEEASNGTLFLDELSSMNLDQQSKLLRISGNRKV
ncbi:MAG: sigma 54-interacting transcriptional regulator [Syntrophaceticus sp.]